MLRFSCFANKCAQRSASPPDWIKLGKMMSPEKVASLRNSISSTQQEISSAPTTVSDVNWDYYNSIISTPGVVDKLKKSYNKLQAAEDDASSIDARSLFFGEEYKKELADAERLKKNGSERSIAIDSELSSLRDELTGLKTMTVEEFLERRPELKERIIDDLMNDKWAAEQ